MFHEIQQLSEWNFFQNIKQLWKKFQHIRKMLIFPFQYFI